MSTDFNIAPLIEQENSFSLAKSVAFASPVHKLVTSCLDWERKGLPFIVQGVPLDASSEGPFDSSIEWLKRLSGTSGQYFSSFSGYTQNRSQDVVLGSSANRLGNTDQVIQGDNYDTRRTYPAFINIYQQPFRHAPSNGQGGWKLRLRSQTVYSLTELPMSFLDLLTQLLVSLGQVVVVRCPSNRYLRFSQLSRDTVRRGYSRNNEPSFALCLRARSIRSLVYDLIP